MFPTPHGRNLRDGYCLRRPGTSSLCSPSDNKVAGHRVANDSTAPRDALQVDYGRRYRIHPSSTRTALGLPGGRRASLRSFIEYKVEMICRDEIIQQAIQVLLQSHPYEEPAYSVYKVLAF